MPPFDDATLKRIAQDQEQPRMADLVKKPDGKAGIWPYLALTGGQAADVITTVQAMGRGAREANPVLEKLGSGGIAAVKAGIAVGSALAIRLLAKEHPKIARALGYGHGAVGAVAAIHNHGVAR